MNRVARFRKWWAEHPENSDNWDLERWRLERETWIRVFTFWPILGFFMLLLGVIVSASDVPLIAFAFLLLSCVFPFSNRYYLRKIAEKEGGT